MIKQKSFLVVLFLFGIQIIDTQASLIQAPQDYQFAYTAASLFTKERISQDFFDKAVTQMNRSERSEQYKKSIKTYFDMFPLSYLKQLDSRIHCSIDYNPHQGVRERYTIMHLHPILMFLPRSNVSMRVAKNILAQRNIGVLVTLSVGPRDMDRVFLSYLQKHWPTF